MLPDAGGRRIMLLPGRWIAIGLLGTMLAVLVALLRTRLTIQLGAPATLIIVLAGCAMVTVRQGFRAPRTEAQRIARDAAEYFGTFILLCLLGAIASYTVAATTSGWVDGTLHRLDTLVGFDWVQWYVAVAERPWLQVLSRAAYGSIFVTPAVLLGTFAFTGNAAEARRFIATFWLAAVLTLILFWFMPAKGALDYLWHGPIPYMPMSELYQAEIIPVLRDATMRQVDLGAIRGLVGPPSFHSVCVVLFIVAVWRVARLRMPLILLNLAMTLAIPVEGTHYLMDMALGAVVAVVALIVVGRLVAMPAAAPRRVATAV